MPKFLLIQTAFLGDVILATSLVEKLHEFYPESSIDFLLRKGNEQVFNGHPYLREVIVFDKKRKIRDLIRILKKIRSNRYDYVFNVQRHFTSGIITTFSKARKKVGFNKNPFSFLFSESVEHIMVGDEELHEIKRNHKLIENITNSIVPLPKLHPLHEHELKVVKLIDGAEKFITIAPASIWYTKQFPLEKWVELIDNLPKNIEVFLVGGVNDYYLTDNIIKASRNKKVRNFAGMLCVLETAVLMKKSIMNYVNDSAPQHIASAINAPVCTVYCSTIPGFGYGPLSDKSNLVEITDLKCKPCGSHGMRKCPEKHFRCAMDIKVEWLLKVLPI